MAMYCGCHDYSDWIYFHSYTNCINHSNQPNCKYFINYDHQNNNQYIGRQTVRDIDENEGLFIDYNTMMYPSFYKQFCKQYGLKNAVELVLEN